MRNREVIASPIPKRLQQQKHEIINKLKN